MRLLTGIAAISLVGLLSACGVENAAGGRDQPKPERSYDQAVMELLAQDYCKDFVREELKSPGSADFSGLTSSGEGKGPWTVTGSVDAENSFGGSLRSRFVCVTHREGEGDWRLDSLTGLQ